MQDHWFNMVGWVVSPLVAASLGAWVYVARKVGDHDVKLGRLETQMTGLETAMKHLPEYQRDNEAHVRELLQRLARMEQKLEDIAARLKNGSSHDDRSGK